MEKFLMPVILIGLYFALQLWILPAMGVNTWMSGKCSPGGSKDKEASKDTAAEESENTKGASE